jgi:nucleotide-binding universal stress UspA family protein
LASEPYALSAEYFDHLDQNARDAAAKNAKDAVEFIKSKFPEPTVKIDEIVELGKPAQVIVETADDLDADLVVVGSHGRGFWRRLSLGSVSDAVSHHASCSVLIVKDRKAEAEK